MTFSSGIRLELGNYLGRGYVECTLPAGLPLDTAAFETIRNDRPPFLCPFTVSGLNGETVLRYDFGNRVSLAYLNGTFSQAEFSRLLHTLIDPLLDGEDWFLDYRYFCFDPQYIYFDRAAMEVSYLYFPVQGPCASDEDIKELFAGLLERCQVPDGGQLTSALYKCLMRRDFSLYEFRQALDTAGTAPQAAPQQPNPAPASQIPVQQPPVQQQIPAAKPAAPQQSPMQQPQQSVQAKPTSGGWNSGSASGGWNSGGTQNGWNAAQAAPAGKPPKAEKGKKADFDIGLSSSSEDDDLEAILSGGKQSKHEKPKKKEKKSGGFHFFDSKPKQPAQQPERREFIGGAAAAPNPSPAPVPVAAAPVDNGNTLIGDDSLPESGAFLRYVGSFRNPQTGGCPPQVIDIRIHDGSFSIGRFDVNKGYQQSDFEFAADINAVSRFHARIEERNGNYVLIHLGSPAGTYVNGQPLAANVPVPLKNGDRVSFSTKGVDYLFTAQ